MKKEIIQILEAYGNGKIGTIYERGLFETPEYYKLSHNRNDFFWDVRSKSEDNAFLMASSLIEGTYKRI